MGCTRVQDAPIGATGMRKLVGVGAVETLTITDMVDGAGVAAAIPEGSDMVHIQPQGGAIRWVDDPAWTPSAVAGSGWLIADGEPFKYVGNKLSLVRIYVPAACTVVLHFASSSNMNP